MVRFWILVGDLVWASLPVSLLVPLQPPASMLALVALVTVVRTHCLLVVAFELVELRCILSLALFAALHQSLLLVIGLPSLSEFVLIT